MKNVKKAIFSAAALLALAGMALTTGCQKKEGSTGGGTGGATGGSTGGFTHRTSSGGGTMGR